MSKTTLPVPTTDDLFAKAESEFEQWEVVKDLIDECIDLMLNYRQSGHPAARARKSTRWFRRCSPGRCAST
jgi:hypothetical protein